MATDSVLGLFQDPQALAMQHYAAQNRAAMEASLQHAQLDPFQRAAQMAYMGGHQVGNAIGSALGAQDPQLQLAALRQNTLKNYDPNTLEGLQGAAKALRDAGDLQGAYALAQRADEAALKESMVTKNLREGTAAATPAALQEYAVAVNQGYKGSFLDYQKELKRAGATNVSVDTRGENKFSETVGTELGKSVIASKTGAEDAAAIIRTNDVGRQLLDSGAITGTGANFFTGFNSALKQAGIDLGYGDAAANTQAYAAAMGANVGKLVKQFGSGTAVSDSDKTYAQRIAGGDVTIDEKAMRRILDINDRASRNVIELHNKKVANIKAPMPLTVEVPSVGKKPPPQAGVPTGGRTGNPLVDKYLPQ